MKFAKTSAGVYFNTKLVQISKNFALKTDHFAAHKC